MFALTNKPEMGARLCAEIIERASQSGCGTDLMKVVQYLAGILVETSFVFDEPEQTMEASLRRLCRMLGSKPYEGPLAGDVLPPPHVLDLETEKGREMARKFFEEWLDCQFEFCDLMFVIIHNLIVQWESHGVSRAESLRLLVECTKKCMAFEIAAQELCDVVIENKVAREGWGMAECMSSLSAVAGRRLALSVHAETSPFFQVYDLPETLDRLACVMTQEAVRHGVCAGSDWRFGLAANDVPVSAPENLIAGIEPYCHSFFATILMFDRYEQAVACAKAAGRMVAVAAGGDEPQMEPVIAKPLAMAAMSDTYKSVCMQHATMQL